MLTGETDLIHLAHVQAERDFQVLKVRQAMCKYDREQDPSRAIQVMKDSTGPRGDVRANGLLFPRDRRTRRLPVPSARHAPAEQVIRQHFPYCRWVRADGEKGVARRLCTGNAEPGAVLGRKMQLQGGSHGRPRAAGDRGSGRSSAAR